MANPDPWAAMAEVVEQAPIAQCPRLLGELERLKASLWIRMTTPLQSTKASHDRLLTAEEVATHLSVTKAYVYKNAGRYPFAVREGRYVRFSQQGLARYIEKHQRRG